MSVSTSIARVTTWKIETTSGRGARAIMDAVAGATAISRVAVYVMMIMVSRARTGDITMAGAGSGS